MEKTKKHVNQFIVCDDGGSDNTVAIAESYKAIVIPRETNEGYGAALKSLFNTDLKIKPDIILTLDLDGQHDPVDIPRLVSHLMENKNDLVIGSRFIQEKSNIPERKSRNRNHKQDISKRLRLNRHPATEVRSFIYPDIPEHSFEIDSIQVLNNPLKGQTQFFYIDNSENNRESATNGVSRDTSRTTSGWKGV